MRSRYITKLACIKFKCISKLRYINNTYNYIIQWNNNIIWPKYLLYLANIINPFKSKLIIAFTTSFYIIRYLSLMKPL